MWIIWNGELMNVDDILNAKYRKENKKYSVVITFKYKEHDYRRDNIIYAGNTEEEAMQCLQKLCNLLNAKRDD